MVTRVHRFNRWYLGGLSVVITLIFALMYSSLFLQMSTDNSDLHNGYPVMKNIFSSTSKQKYNLTKTILENSSTGNPIGFKFSSLRKNMNKNRDTLEELQEYLDQSSGLTKTPRDFAVPPVSEEHPVFEVPDIVLPKDTYKYTQRLDFEAEDVMVVLHIQKTGCTTFNHYLTHILYNPPCTCQKMNKVRCQCYSKNGRLWLVSRYSTGDYCGLHPDWTELQVCVDQWFRETDVQQRKRRKYHMITILRNSESRFTSEHRHVRVGATWGSAHLWCNGSKATREQVPRCYDGDGWGQVSIHDFIACKSNLAINRMTRMLADLSLVNCYDRSNLSDKFVHDTMLQSAKDNLVKLSFFGIMDELLKTQFLFENTFGLRFNDTFEQRGDRSDVEKKFGAEVRVQVRELNSMDVELYEFGKKLFQERVRRMEMKKNFTVSEYFDTIRDKLL